MIEPTTIALDLALTALLNTLRERDPAMTQTIADTPSRIKKRGRRRDKL